MTRCTALLLGGLFLALMPRDAHALRVVATTSDLAAIAKSIGGDRAEVSALALHTQDPHWVDARPHLALDLARADLLIAVGLDLEVGWLPVLQKGARNSAILPGGRGFLDCSKAVELLDVPQAKVDRSMGDIHPGGNPHYLWDPSRAERVAQAIAARMTELEPKNKSVFDGNLAAFRGKLTEARTRWQASLAALRGKKVIAYHASMAYLAQWLGLTIIEHVEPKPGIAPNPRHVAHVLTVAREQGVRLFVQESWFPDTTSGTLAERSGAALVRLPGGPDFPHGEDYVTWMSAIVAKLAAAVSR
jgi:zinc/manganese transport system substrate-binding protein